VWNHWIDVKMKRVWVIHESKIRATFHIAGLFILIIQSLLFMVFPLVPPLQHLFCMCDRFFAWRWKESCQYNVVFCRFVTVCLCPIISLYCPFMKTDVSESCYIVYDNDIPFQTWTRVKVCLNGVEEKNKKG